MVYHMKKENIEFLQDMMCAMPKFVEDIFVDILEKDLHIKPDTRSISTLIRDCSCTRTKEGTEACLNAGREDIAPRAWMGRAGELPEFENFLELLDKKIEEFKKNYAEKHII